MIQNSAEWHEWRKGGVGASEVAAILGIDPYGNTPYSTWLVKTGRSKGFEGNSFTEHGKEIEAKARARYELLNMEDMPPAEATHPKYSICRCSLDGVRTDNKLILEIKCPRGNSTVDAVKAGKIPEHYWPQVQYQLAVTGADLCHFFVYHEETDADYLVEVKPDVQYQGKIISAVLDFWQKYVLTDTAPALTDKDVKLIEDDGSIKSLCEKLLMDKDTMKKAMLDSLKAEIVKLAGHPKMRCGSVQISTVLRKGAFSYHKLTIVGDKVSA